MKRKEILISLLVEKIEEEVRGRIGCTTLTKEFQRKEHVEIKQEQNAFDLPTGRRNGMLTV